MNVGRRAVKVLVAFGLVWGPGLWIPTAAEPAAADPVAVRSGAAHGHEPRRTAPAARHASEPGRAPQVWFAPLQDEPPQEDSHGSVDYFDLFERDAPWKKAAGRVDVFKIYGGWILNSVTATDARVRRVVSDLERREIDIAFEVGPLNPTPRCGLDIEGFSHGPTNGPIVIERIEDAGGSVDYVAMDEPFFYASLYDGPRACGWSATKVARKVAAFVEAVHDVAPNAVVGDIEPLVSGFDVKLYKDWIRAYARVTGEELPFIHIDTDWARTDWPAAVRGLERFARGRGIDFGVIYDGGAPSGTDRSWARRAEDRIASYEVEAGGRPDHAVFQSWSDLPDHVLPETEPHTFTWLINRYFRTRTGLSLDVATGVAGGTLATASGAPISDARVTVWATPTSGPGVFAEYAYRGTVPPGAVEAVAVFRVNTECDCAGEADLTLYEASYAEGSEAGNRVPNGDFAAGLQGWEYWGDGTIELQPSDRGGTWMLHVAASSDRAAAANSAHFPVTPGRSYTATFGARVSPSSLGTGYFGIVFVSATEEAGRDRILLGPPALRIGSATTDDEGAFQIALAGLGPGGSLVEARYRGSNRYWPAYAAATAG